MNVRDEGDVVVVTPKGWLVGGDETDQLEETLRQLVAGDRRRVVLDLSEVVMMNSLAVGALMGCCRNYRDRAGRLVLCGLNRRLVRIFLITQLTLVFELHETLADALAALAQVA